MNVSEAKNRLQTLWTHTVETNMGCAMQVEESLTEEYPWGWVFYFVPRQPDECRWEYKKRVFAFHRETGDSIPVGTKGLEDALKHLKTKL